ncbi:MAG: DUF4838 domain-containing protein [Planctomycetota bacterium]|nr:DUF4838 domain-containing protein [Planctomycetota bacterium]
MKSFCHYIITISALSSVCDSAPTEKGGLFKYSKGQQTILLSENGQAQAVIVIRKDAPPPAKFAAEELKEHLDQMTGAEFPVTDSIPAGKSSIVLGNFPEALKTGIDVKRIARDGYQIRTVGQTIFIAGKDDETAKSEVLFKAKTLFGKRPSRYAMERHLGAATWDFERGTLYGVYRFLEELGVRWFLPGDKGRVIPERRNLSLQAVDIHEEPAFILRNAGRATWQWYQLNGAHIRRFADVQEYEDLERDGRSLRLWLLRMRHSSEWFAFNHRPPRTELEQRYGKEHPEYFAVRPSGERDLQPQPGRTGHLCYTHPGALEITQRDVDDYFAGKDGKEMGFTTHSRTLNPFNRGWSASANYGRTVSLLPHDSFRGCECENCLEFTSKEGDRAAMHSRLVWQFVEKAANWMKDAHPEKLITCLAYSSYSERPPKLRKLPENVVVGMCPAQYARTHNTVEEAHYKDLFRMVNEWNSVNERPMLIWLHHLYRHRSERRRGVPMLLTKHLARMFKDLSKHANLATIEIDTDSIMLEHINRYVMLRILYNPNLDPEELVADYAKNFYGPGADIVLPMLKDIEARSIAVAGTYANNIDVWEKHFSQELMKEYRVRADALVAKTKGTKYATAADWFSRYFIGAMEKGRAIYVRDVKNVLARKDANVSIRQLVGEIKIDGDLNEEGWQRSSKRKFISNVDGKMTEWRTEIRFLRAPEHLYFAFTCFDPNTLTLPDRKGEADSIEFFLDPEHDHDSYYFVQIDIAGRVNYEWYFEGGGEPPDRTWRSGLARAIKRTKDRWVVEIKLPRKSIIDGLIRPDGRPWGANFGRSTGNPPRPEDRFSCWSPLLRGKFHQPDLFGHLYFAK